MLFSTMDFAYPYFLTMWHCVFATICTQILVRTTNWFPGVKDAKVTATVIISKVMPLSICFAFSLVCGNTAYKYLSVAYIQMIKSMTPVLMLLIAFLIGRERISLLQLSIVGMISGGVAIASAGELHFSAVGVLLQLAAMVTDCCRITLLETVSLLASSHIYVVCHTLYLANLVDHPVTCHFFSFRPFPSLSGAG